MALSVSIGKLTKLLIITVKGDGVGMADGPAEGVVVGSREGLVEGVVVGCRDGPLEGVVVGFREGPLEGVVVGGRVGLAGSVNTRPEEVTVKMYTL